MRSMSTKREALYRSWHSQFPTEPLCADQLTIVINAGGTTGG